MSILGMDSVDDLLKFNQGIIDEFRANAGCCGGMFEGNPMILLTMKGAKSGRELTSPLSYCADGDDCIIMASAGGSPNHPNWYHNIVANPEVIVERGDERYSAQAVMTGGGERTEAFAKMTTALPRFADYQAAVDREIPVFRIVRL